ncbi:hypothetical protein L6452_18250 [Arctium lappa]|uniref:Uncharacterized protein n=1 Tax=Arctium lappa TaxID=4217 RepID=A0ACB9C5L8_ARCLA|nr:hypothetical protein L6452_18250 [Arctium lappa]
MQGSSSFLAIYDHVTWYFFLKCTVGFLPHLPLISKVNKEFMMLLSISSCYFTFEESNFFELNIFNSSLCTDQMEFSKYLGIAEGCNSSESGWTMYIVSPMHETNNNHHYHHHHAVDDGIDEIHDDYCHMHHNEDSDDSMVSDASSGPSRQGILRGNSKRRSGLRRDQSKHAVNKDLMGKNQRQVEKLYDRRQRAGKEEEYKNRNDNKARKTN